MPHWTCADGTRIAGDIVNPRGAPTVILAHGGGQTRHAWRRLADALGGRGLRAVTYDARGHGESGRAARGDYGESALVSDLVAVAKGVGAARPILVGASVGGATALAAIGTGQIDAAGLVLVDMAARTEQAGYDRIRAFMLRGLEGFATPDEAAVAVAAYRGAPQRDGAGLARSLHRAADGRFYWHWDPAFLEARHRDFPQRAARLSAYAARLACPVLLLRGGSSDVVSPEGAAHFRSLCPQARYVDIAGAGHMAGGMANDAFAAAVLDFVAAAPPR